MDVQDDPAHRHGLGSQSWESELPSYLPLSEGNYGELAPFLIKQRIVDTVYTLRLRLGTSHRPLKGATLFLRRYGVKEDISVFLPVLPLAHDKGESEQGCRKFLPSRRVSSLSQDLVVGLRAEGVPELPKRVAVEHIGIGAEEQVRRWHPV
jgi:hypothetical protein